MKSEYHYGMDAGEALIIAEIERLAGGAETPEEQAILISLLNHLTIKYPEPESV
jgi:hypothetical protein